MNYYSHQCISFSKKRLQERFSFSYFVINKVSFFRSQQLVKQRFRNMMKTSALLLALLFLYLVCVIPICVYNVVSLVPKKGRPNVPLGIAIFMVYWIQYGVNFLVYAASNANYRKAYKQFFQSASELSRWILKKKRWRDHHQTTKMSCISSNVTMTYKLSPLQSPVNSDESRVIAFQHQQELRLSKPQTLQRLKSCPVEETHHKPIHKFLEGQRRFNTLPAAGLQFWCNSKANNGTQSSRSSVVTLESVVMHKTDTGIQI